jgi:hypothetical protein
VEVEQILIDFDQEISRCSRKKARENSSDNWSRCTFDEFLEETVYLFADGKSRLSVRLELEYGTIVPLVVLVTNKQGKEDEIRRYLQLLTLAVWEDYKLEETNGIQGSAPSVM